MNIKTAFVLVTCLLLGPLAAAAEPPPMPPLAVRLLPGTEASVLDDLVNARAVKGQAPAALQLDLAHKRIMNAAGQIVTESDGRNPIHLQGIIDKWRYAPALEALAAAHPQEMHIDTGPNPLRTPPDPPAVYKGEQVAFVVTNVPAERQLVVFNLSPIGTLQLLYPPDPEADTLRGDRVAVPAVVTSPFGVDHVVAVSAADPAGMQALTTWLAETASADGMLDSRGAFLDQVRALRNVRVGMLATFSCLNAANCKR